MTSNKREIYETNIYKPHLYIIQCNSVSELQQSKQNTVDQIIGKWNFKKIWEESETQINMIVKAVEKSWYRYKLQKKACMQVVKTCRIYSSNCDKMMDVILPYSKFWISIFICEIQPIMHSTDRQPPIPRLFDYVTSSC